MFVYCDHEVPRWRTVFFLKQWRLRCPHSSCGGRDIACGQIGELRELGRPPFAIWCFGFGLPIDADAAGSGDSSIQKVGSAIRMLGAGFFHDVTGVKRTKLKTYDQATLMAESVGEDESAHDVYAAEDDVMNEDEMMETLLSEGDHDATSISDFENAASEVIQNDEELAAAFNTYTEARKRLSEKFCYRGFWPVSQGDKTKGHAKGKVKGKFQKGHSSTRKSLEQRILSSRCRI